MTAAYLAPVEKFRAWDNNGAPLVGGKVYTYSAGTSTPVATYTDSTAGTPNANPVILNNRGECDIWLIPNTGYKFVLQDSAGNQIWSVDSVYNSQLITLFGGVDTGQPNAYVLTFTANFSGYTNGTVIYWVPSNNNTGASTINVNGIGVVNIVNPNGTALGANQIVANQMAQVVYYNGSFQLVSVGNFTGSTIGTFGTETPIPSAATVNLGSALAHVVLVTGTTSITSFGSSASLSAPIYMVRFNGALTLTYNATTMILPGAASIVTTAGDALIAQYLGAGAWKVLVYQYSAGSSNQKIKPADTARISNAVLTVDPDLVSNTLAIGRYAFEVYLVFDSVAAGAGFQWTNIGSAVDSRALMPALASGWVNGAAYGPKQDTFYGTTITYATVSNTANSNQVLYKGSMLVGTVGTIAVEWAQAVSTASATTLRAGSYLTVTQLNVGSAANIVNHTYSAAGSGTETIPTGYSTVTIEVWGAPGGGGVAFISGMNAGGGGGGGGGGYVKSVISVAGLGGQTMTYTVGAKGLVAFGGTASSVVAGTFSMTTMTAGGGAPGAAATALNMPGNGGVGGTAVGGVNLNTVGFAGSAGNTNLQGGDGGTGGSGISGTYGGGNGGGQGGGPFGVSAGNGIGDGLIIFVYQ